MRIELLTFVLLLPSFAAAVEPAAEPPAPSEEAAPVDSDAIGEVVKSAAGAGEIVGSPAPKLVVEDPKDPAYLIGKELRCPVCQGMPIADSPSEMAQDMMKKIRAMHAEGKSREEILTYFTQSYGEWVLLRPQAEGVTWVVWLLPPAALLAGLWLVRRTVQRGPAPEVKPADPNDDDEYRRRVREEVQA